MQANAALLNTTREASPNWLRLKAAVERGPLSRSGIYREIAAGRVRAKKLGKALLVDMTSVDALIEELPDATIRTAA